MAAHIIRPLGKHHSADIGPAGSPGLNLGHHLGALPAPGEFLGRDDSSIGGGGSATARDLESVSGEDGLALIFVKSGHDRLLFP
jgi:hypothetical protein